MKKLNSALIGGLLLYATAAAQPQLQGDVSGTYGPGNYLVVGDITLPEGQSMVMLPGTNFLFVDNNRFTVCGHLQAVGNTTDSVRFIPDDAGHRWAGIHFRESEQSALAYCQISGSDSGGIDLFHSDPMISNCTISDNSTPWRGGGIWVGYWECNTTISNCTISDNFANYSGGGISTGYHCLITHCVITNNSTNGEGGGIEVDQSSPTISNCTISNNEAYGGGDCGGGGIVIYKGNPTISHCLITGNSANALGGGLLLSDANPTISNCTIGRNSADTGGGIFFEVYYPSITTIVNTIVEGNLGNYGVYFQWGPYADITFSDFHNNQQGNFYNPPAGVGTLVGVNVNGDSCDVFFNIFEDPLFEDPQNGNFHLTWANYPVPDSTMSPCIDAGDPDRPLDPDGTIADIGAFYFDQEASLTITMTPYNPPIIIPASGGSFNYNIAVANNSDSIMTFDVWCDVRLPDSTVFGPLLGPVNATVPAGFSGDRDRSQNVPGGAPSGSYSYHGYVGVYPDDIWNQDSFTFEKLGADESDWGSGWLNRGESFDGKGDSRIAPTGVPETYSLGQNYPNPFNPVTTIRYGLTEDAFVKLTIYDLLGRQVAELVNGWRDAGMHEVTFDGSGLAAGVYVYRLTVDRVSGSGATPTTMSGKMVLMK